MSSSHSVPTLNGLGNAPTVKEKFELVERVVSSSVFSRSPAMRAFLLYITKHAIEERPERIKEQCIGAEVLGRRPNYDPAEDNIVRVRAHELRQRLEKYFANEGAQEPFIITVPKGTYVPEFHARPIAVEVEAQEVGSPTVPLPVAVAEIQLPEKRPQSRWSPLWLAGSAIAIIAVVVSVFLYTSARQSKKSAEVGAPAKAIQDFWGQFFVHPDEELRVVAADTGFGLWQDMSGNNLNLGDYLSRKYLQMPNDKLREVAVRRSTSPADLSISLQLSSLAREFGGHISPQYARDIGSRAFQNGNVVILGSHRSNPWVEVFEPRLNFVVERDQQTNAPLFRNKVPKARESATYSLPAMLDVNGAEQKELESYGLVALLKGCNGHDLVVLLEGLNMEATEAAGETVTNPRRLESVLRSIGHKPGTDVTPFEALIKLTSLPGGYANSEVIAYRIESGASCSY